MHNITQSLLKVTLNSNQPTNIGICKYQRTLVTKDLHCALYGLNTVNNILSLKTSQLWQAVVSTSMD